MVTMMVIFMVHADGKDCSDGASAGDHHGDDNGEGEDEDGANDGDSGNGDGDGHDDYGGDG